MQFNTSSPQTPAIRHASVIGLKDVKMNERKKEYFAIKYFAIFPHKNTVYVRRVHNVFVPKKTPKPISICRKLVQPLKMRVY